STADAIRNLIACALAERALVKVLDLSVSRANTMQNDFKSVHILSRAGLTAAARGRPGRARLTRPPQPRLDSDIVRTLATTARVSDTGTGVTSVLDDALEAFIAVLDRHSLADMVARETSGAADKAKPAQRGGRAPAKSRGKSSRKPLQTATA